MAKTLGSVAEGSVVYLNESGNRVAFYVAKHDYESALNGAGRTLLVRSAPSDDSEPFNSSNINTYSGSDLDKWLNGTYLARLDGFVAKAAGKTKFYSCAGNGSKEIITVEATVFCLSATETAWGGTNRPTEGTELTTASTITSAAATYNTDWGLWLRTPYTNNTNKAARMYYSITSGVIIAATEASKSHHPWPSVTLPAETNVDDSGNITEPAASLPHGAMIDDVVCPITECYAEVEIVRCPVAYGLTTIDGVTMTIPFGPSAETIEQYPSIVGNLTYTGSAQSPQWADYDSSKMSIGGTQSGTNAGSYTTTFTPLEGYVWPDGSTDAYSVTWSIAKAAGKVTLSKTSISLGAGESTTFTVTRSGNGAISVSSNATSKATATLSGTTVTVTGVAIGSATITVNVAEGTNHLAASATCAVTVIAKQYAVTIRTTTPGYTSSTYAYFYINGTKYSGSPTVTLSVNEGTAWSAVFASGLSDRGTYMNGRYSMNNSGTVTSNMDVDVRGIHEPSYNYLAYYIYITTS